jgi:hypothetical protein
MRVVASVLAGIGILIGCAATPAIAQPLIGGPGSALIFPLFQSGGGRTTLITVTNTSSSTALCGNGFRQGDVLLKYHYFSVSSGQCVEADRLRLLTPSDTITVVTSQDNPAASLGWLWVEALDPESHRAIDFDFLIGSAILADTVSQFRMRYLPYAFRAYPPGIVGRDRCDRVFTDANHNGRADFDGIEYDFWPSRLYLDEFIQESGAVTSELFVASADRDPTDGSDTLLDFLIVNNREQTFSRSDVGFDCYLHRPLAQFSAIFTNLFGDPNELRSGGHGIQMGWLQVTGDDAVLAVFLQHVGTGSVAEGTTLQCDGAFGGPGDTGHTPVSLTH